MCALERYQAMRLVANEFREYSRNPERLIRRNRIAYIIQLNIDLKLAQP